MQQYLLITGGLGFIGSHICVELLNLNYNVIVVDNLSNSKISVLDNIIKITGKNNILFFDIDILNFGDLNTIFKGFNIMSVIHLAGFKSINESLIDPLNYYTVNVTGTINLLNVMKMYNCKKLIMSSSAAVYGNQQYPVTENSYIGQNITSPYGRTKYAIELILEDLFQADKTWSIVILRYFNPIGAHESGLIGEDPNGKPNNLFPYLLKVAVGIYPELTIFGNDYLTSDGTCIRDFVHVVDLAKGHVKSLEKLINSNYTVYNLGSGVGVSILELINIFNKVNNIDIKYSLASRREGDLPRIYTNVEKVQNELGWKTEKTLEDACRDGFKFIKSTINKA